MKNSIQITIVIVSLMGLVAAAPAKEGNRGGGNSNGNHNRGGNNSGNNNKQGNKPFGANVAKSNNDIFQHLSHNGHGQDHDHHGWNHGKPDAPYVRPQGDGRVPTPDVPTDTGTMTLLTPPNSTPPGNTRPGYVWTNGYWERVKATGSSVHTPSNLSPAAGRPGGGVYAPSFGYGVKPPPVANNGTITVTDTKPQVLTGPMTSSGIEIGDILSLGNPQTIIDHLPPYGFTVAPNPRDHRTPNKDKNQR